MAGAQVVHRPTEFITAKPSVADRNVKRHRYGAIIGVMVDPFRHREIQYESGLERRWCQVFVASPLVAEIREQQLLKIRMPDGKVVMHYFDLVVLWTNGEVTAFACKYEKDIKDDLLALLERAAATVGDSFASDYRTLSQIGLSELRVHNARRVIECGQEQDYPAQAVIRSALPHLGRDVRLAELDAIVGDGNRGSRAAIAMIQQGVFGVRPGERIGFVPALRNLFTK